MAIFYNIIVFFASILIYFTNGIISEGVCGDWEAYKSETCLKIFEVAGLLNYADAERYCKEEQNGSDLLSIAVEEKQEFIETFLKSNSVVDYVWIGLKYKTNNWYQWPDDTKLHYSNWGSGSPKNDTNQCVQIETDDEQFGEWSEVLCSKKNLVVCEKLQDWTLNQMQTILRDVIKNPVPVGFIYVQLPKEKSPGDIWPWMEWDDVSLDYAGMFFRAEGGNAAEFGKVQEEDSPRLIYMEVDSTKGLGHNHGVNVKADGEFSYWLGIHGQPVIESTEWSMRVKVSKAETRPRNMAMKIWKRVK